MINLRCLLGYSFSTYIMQNLQNRSKRRTHRYTISLCTNVAIVVVKRLVFRAGQKSSKNSWSNFRRWERNKFQRDIAIYIYECILPSRTMDERSVNYELFTEHCVCVLFNLVNCLCLAIHILAISVSCLVLVYCVSHVRRSYKCRLYLDRSFLSCSCMLAL